MTNNHSQHSEGPRLLTVPATHQGQRIDNYLLTELKGVPKSLLYRLLRKGQIRVNKGRIKPLYRLQANDVIRLPPLKTGDRQQNDSPPAQLCQQLEQRILFEDDDCLILNKPAGLAVHGGSNIRFGVIEIMRHVRPDCPDLALVHRLDRQTSGCLMLAKQRHALLQLHELLRQANGIHKQYLALVKGAWHGGPRRIELALQINRLNSGDKHIQVDEAGKPASSVFEAIEHYAGCTLMSIKLDTGRMHQIRVHAAHIHHPVAGDDKYGDRAFNRVLRKQGLKRMFLHARSLVFTLPGSDEPISVVAELDEELETFLHTLEKRQC